MSGIFQGDCSELRHNFRTWLFGRYFNIIHEATSETRTYTEPLTGRGKGKGTWQITQRKYDSYAVCRCRAQRIDLGPFWKTEEKIRVDL